MIIRHRGTQVSEATHGVNAVGVHRLRPWDLASPWHPFCPLNFLNFLFLPYESSLPRTRRGLCRCIALEAKRIANPFPRKRPPETAEAEREWSGREDIKVQGSDYEDMKESNVGWPFHPECPPKNLPTLASSLSNFRTCSKSS